MQVLIHPAAQPTDETAVLAPIKAVVRPRDFGTFEAQCVEATRNPTGGVTRATLLASPLARPRLRGAPLGGAASARRGRFRLLG